MTVGYPEPGGEEFTDGHSGTDTSRTRALDDSRSGTSAARRQWVTQHLGYRGTHGLTVKELREWTGWHHGVASSTLTAMHKAGLIDRLSTTRDRCKVYVLPRYVEGRATERPTPNRPKGEADTPLVTVLTGREETVLERVKEQIASGRYVSRLDAQVLVTALERMRS